MRGIKKIYYLFQQLVLINRINKRLKNKIVSCGLDNNIPYVELLNGFKFFGFKSQPYQKKLFFLFNKSIKQKLKSCPDCINILFDIDFRYFPPKTERETYDMGKYYNVNKGEIVLELGAYIGMYAIKMSEIVGVEGKVIAVEAIEDNYSILKKNVESNSISNIIPMNKAIWNKDEDISFFRTENQENSAVTGVVDEDNIITVEGATIDTIVKNNNLLRVDFIRIQVNGAEVEALQGMLETFKLKPIVMVTVVYISKKAVLQILQENGYETTEYKYSVLAIPK